MITLLLLLVECHLSTQTNGSLMDRSSDPLSFADGPVAPIPIGPPHEISQDVVGDPISLDELLYPPLVDPPMEIVREDPIEKAGLFEGDIIVGTVDEFLELTDVNRNSLSNFTRNAVKTLQKLWPKGNIPYVISSSFDRYERGAIAFAMKEFQDNTCIRFKAKTSEKDYIHLIKADGCSSSVGKVGGSQIVSLGKGCLTKGVVIHELMHTMGFWHEQARPDRDNYITIIWSNIQDGLHYNFGKHDWDTIQNLSVSYDLGSIMHYGPNAFAKNREKPTILSNSGEEIGQRYGLSEKDILKINILYKCNKTESNSWESSLNLIEDIVPPQTDEKLLKNCKFWASQGECKKNRPYMMKYCLTECLQHEEKEKQGQCKDSNPQCNLWASQEQCKLNPQYMLVFCEKSCKKC